MSDPPPTPPTRGVADAAAAGLAVSRVGNRFVADRFPDDAFLEFAMADQGAVMDMRHTFVAPRGRGKGLAAAVTAAAFEDVKARGLRARPSCSYISGHFLSKHPEYRELCV